MRALILACSLLISTPGLAQERIVALGSAITETLFALGDGDSIVGVDTTSTWPAAARAKPQVGYFRQLGAEGVLSLKPTLVIGTTQAGPPETLAKLRAAGVPVKLFQAPRTLESALALIEGVADLRNKPALGERIRDDIRQHLASLPQMQDKPRVLAVLAGHGGVMAAGRENAADLMIQLAGGLNVAAEFTGYKPLSSESLIGLEPQVILVPDHVVDLAGGLDALLAQPGLAQTPAAKNRRVVVMDSALLLGLGPRLGAAVRELSQSLHAPPSKASAKLNPLTAL